MVPGRKPISFTACWEGEKFELQTYERAYRNLMVLLYDKIYPDGFGECKGMGRCGTCVVKIEGLPADANKLHGNEESTLQKIGFLQQNIRLACQVLIDENLQDVYVEILGGDVIG